MVETIGTVLVLYSWILVAVLVVFLFLIGRLYEVKFKRRSYYQLGVIPLVLFVTAAVWYAFFPGGSGASMRDFVGLVLPDLFFLVGGLMLVGLCYSLLRIMIPRKA